MDKQLKYVNIGSVFLAHQGVRRILHITTHLGGGVGDTVFNYFMENNKDGYYKHEVVILGYALDKVIDKAWELNIPLHLNISHKEIIEMIPDFDIILIHVWNHPLLYDFLIRNELPPCRLIMWGHNSGFHPPNIFPRKLLEYPDLFVFTTPISYKIKEAEGIPKEHFYDIFSTADVMVFKHINRKFDGKFNIGYIGTVDYAKLHPDFLDICKDVDFIPNVKFIVVGGNNEKEIEKQANEMEIGDKFEFTGRLSLYDLINYLWKFDVFGYPLAPYHYGTCDLVLQIAMASGITPVVFNNEMEKNMVKNNKSGLIAKNKKEYIHHIKTLYDNINYRKELSDSTRKYALERFSLEKLKEEWNKTFDKILEFPKKKRLWKHIYEKLTPLCIFCESIGDYANPFLTFDTEKIKELSKNPSWQTKTKGSVHNYFNYFQDDKFLEKFSEFMKKHR